MMDFEKRLADLDFLSECEPTMDAFTGSYEKLLVEVTAIEDRGQRRERLQRMKEILLKQTAYLSILWLREKAAMTQEALIQ